MTHERTALRLGREALAEFMVRWGLVLCPAGGAGSRRSWKSSGKASCGAVHCVTETSFESTGSRCRSPLGLGAYSFTGYHGLEHHAIGTVSCAGGEKPKVGPTHIYTCMAVSTQPKLSTAWVRSSPASVRLFALRRPWFGERLIELAPHLAQTWRQSFPREHRQRPSTNRSLVHTLLGQWGEEGFLRPHCS